MAFNLASKSVFVTRLLTSGLLFSTAVNAELLAKPLILGILSYIKLTLVLKSVFLTKPLILGIFFVYIADFLCFLINIY